MNGVRVARADERALLQDIYLRCFADTKAVMEAVFSAVWQPGQTLVSLDGSEIVGMVMLPRFSIAPSGASCGYIYALCTLPEHRGRGHMTELLNASHAFCAARGDDFTMLVPAEPSLFELYARFGYRIGFYKGECVFMPAASPLPLRRAVPEDYPDMLAAYEREFAGSPHIRRDAALLASLDALYSADGGGFFRCGDGYVLLDCYGQPSVREACPREAGLYAASAFGMPIAGSLPSASGVPYGCVRGVEPGGFMFNLLYD